MTPGNGASFLLLFFPMLYSLTNSAPTNQVATYWTRGEMGYLYIDKLVSQISIYLNHCNFCKTNKQNLEPFSHKCRSTSQKRWQNVCESTRADYSQFLMWLKMTLFPI